MLESQISEIIRVGGHLVNSVACKQIAFRANYRNRSSRYGRPAPSYSNEDSASERKITNEKIELGPHLPATKPIQYGKLVLFYCFPYDKRQLVLIGSLLLLILSAPKKFPSKRIYFAATT